MKVTPGDWFLTWKEVSNLDRLWVPEQTLCAREKFDCEKLLMLEISFYWLEGKPRVDLLCCKFTESRGGKRSSPNDVPQWIPPQDLNCIKIQLLSSTWLCLMTQTAKQHISPINIQKYLHEKAQYFQKSLSKQSCTERAPKVRSGALSWMCTEKQDTGWRAASMFFKSSLPARLPALHCTLSPIAFTRFLTWSCKISRNNELVFLTTCLWSPPASLGWKGGIPRCGRLTPEQRQHMEIHNPEQQGGAALSELWGSDYCSQDL